MGDAQHDAAGRRPGFKRTERWPNLRLWPSYQ